MDALETPLEPLGGMAAFENGDRVLLKPTSLTGRVLEGSALRAELVYAVAQMVQDAVQAISRR